MKSNVSYNIVCDCPYELAACNLLVVFKLTGIMHILAVFHSFSLRPSTLHNYWKMLHVGFERRWPRLVSSVADSFWPCLQNQLVTIWTAYWTLASETLGGDQILPLNSCDDWGQFKAYQEPAKTVARFAVSLVKCHALRNPLTNFLNCHCGGHQQGWSTHILLFGIKSVWISFPLNLPVVRWQHSKHCCMSSLVECGGVCSLSCLASFPDWMCKQRNAVQFRFWQLSPTGSSSMFN